MDVNLLSLISSEPPLGLCTPHINPHDSWAQLLPQPPVALPEPCLGLVRFSVYVMHTGDYGRIVQGSTETP